MKNKILFLDFDGVLFDTLKEVYLVNRYEYLGIDIFDAVDLDQYQLYSKYKFLVYNIWMFYYFNPLIFDKIPENEIVYRYKKALENRDLKAEEEFCKRFLDIRANLVKNHYNFWKNLETPYEFFQKIKELKETIDPEIVVISKKNKASIIERFNSYNFNLNPEKIFAREFLANYSTKGEFMEEYMQKNNFTSAIFVDDNINNLKSSEK